MTVVVRSSGYPRDEDTAGAQADAKSRGLIDAGGHSDRDGEENKGQWPRRQREGKLLREPQVVNGGVLGVAS